MRNIVTFLRSRQLLAVAAAVAVTLMAYTMTYGTQADPSDPTLDGVVGAADLTDTDIDLGDYRAIQGGKFPPPGGLINGDNASGGTYRALDEGFGVAAFVAQGAPNAWAKDDFFSNEQGLAFTLRNGGTAIWDNNGIEDGTFGTYYDEGGAALNPDHNPGDIQGPGGSARGSSPDAGLISTFQMSNFFDFIYASRVELVSTATTDEIIAYFDGNGPSAFPFDPDHPLLMYRINIWSASTADPLLPTHTGSFVGDVLSTDSTPGTFTRSDTGVTREFTTAGVSDPIFRLTWIPDSPITLPAGVYYFSHDVRIQLDDDGDGVPNAADQCPDSTLDSTSLNPNQYAQNSIVVGQFDFYSTFGPFEAGPNDDQSVVYDIADTDGCTCAQIIEALGVGKGHSKKGCSPSVMEEFTGSSAKPDREAGIGRR